MNTFDTFVYIDDEDTCKEIAKLLVIPCEVTALHVEVDYTISDVIATSFEEPMEGGEIDVRREVVVGVKHTKGWFYVSKRQSELLQDYIDLDEVTTACYKDNENKLEDNSYEPAIARYEDERWYNDGC